METIYFKPLWRDYDRDVPLEMVVGPTKEWLDAVTPLIRTMRVIRFAVLQNGEILVGDAYKVLHRDLARCGRRLRDESNDDDYVEPLIGASLVHDGEHWRFGILQYYGYGPEKSKTRFYSLAAKLSTWKELTEALGNDPTTVTPYLNHGEL